MERRVLMRVSGTGPLYMDVPELMLTWSRLKQLRGFPSLRNILW